MIGSFVQPGEIFVDEELSLVRYYRNYRRTLPWYQDLGVCKQVDDIDFPYDLDRLSRMYRYLSKNGECYYLKLREGGRCVLAGDISLCKGEISIVICRAYQNRHLGRRAVWAILKRAEELGLDEVEARIYTFNEQSRRMFLAAGFTQVGEECYRYRLGIAAPSWTGSAETPPEI